MSASHYPAPVKNDTSPPPLASDDAIAPSLRPAALSDMTWADESAVFALSPWLDPTPANAGLRSAPPAGFASEVARELTLFDAENDTEPGVALRSEDVGEVFCAYRSYVAKIARRILGSSSEVDDLIQDVFLTTLKDIHKVKDPARLRAWLATVTTRMAKRRRFRTSLRPTLNHEDPEELFELATEDAPSPESTADLSGNIQRVLSLPDELRTPWMLKHVEGRTLQDVAAQCDCSLSTAARRIQTATGKIQRR